LSFFFLYPEIMRRIISALLLVLMTAVHTVPAASTAVPGADMRVSALADPSGAVMLHGTGEPMFADAVHAACCGEAVLANAHAGSPHCASDCLTLLPTPLDLMAPDLPKPDALQVLGLVAGHSGQTDHPPRAL